MKIGEVGKDSLVISLGCKGKSSFVGANSNH